MFYPTVNFNDLDYKEAAKYFKEYGVLVIENVFDQQTCDNYMDKTIKCFENIGSGVDRNNLAETWIPENLPPQTRQGMFQALVSGSQPVWEMRNSEKLKTLYRNMYYNVRKNEEKYTHLNWESADDVELVSSIDGINFQPSQTSTIKEFSHDFTDTNVDQVDKNDWAHCDQTAPRDEPFKCIQGSLCLSETTAGFRCTPKSHLVFEQILDQLNVRHSGNWLKFKHTDIKNVVEPLVKSVGGNWQIPVIVKPGSFIMWFSSTIHSAIPASKRYNPTVEKPWLGWRGVYYICYRPAIEFSKSELLKREQNIIENRVMNHWTTKTFGKNPASFRFKKDNTGYHPVIENLIQNPKLMYKILNFNPACRNSSVNLDACDLCETVSCLVGSDKSSSVVRNPIKVSNANKHAKIQGKSNSKLALVEIDDDFFENNSKNKRGNTIAVNKSGARIISRKKLKQVDNKKREENDKK